MFSLGQAASFLRICVVRASPTIMKEEGSYSIVSHTKVLASKFQIIVLIARRLADIVRESPANLHGSHWACVCLCVLGAGRMPHAAAWFAALFPGCRSCAGSAAAAPPLCASTVGTCVPAVLRLGGASCFLVPLAVGPTGGSSPSQNCKRKTMYTYIYKLYCNLVVTWAACYQVDGVPDVRWDPWIPAFVWSCTILGSCSLFYALGCLSGQRCT